MEALVGFAVVAFVAVDAALINFRHRDGMRLRIEGAMAAHPDATMLVVGSLLVISIVAAIIDPWSGRRPALIVGPAAAFLLVMLARWWWRRRAKPN